MNHQSLKCVDARHLVHLSVGDDTLAEEEQQLVEHLHDCADCRAYHAGMMGAMHVLERVRDDDSSIPSGSIWPGLAAQLKSRRKVETQPERRRFNVSVATLCACSLVLALVTAVQNLPSNDTDPFADLSRMPATTVSFGPGAVQNGQMPAMQPMPNMQPSQLVPVRQADGTVVLVDSVSGRVYIPNMLPVATDSRDLNF